MHLDTPCQIQGVQFPGLFSPCRALAEGLLPDPQANESKTRSQYLTVYMLPTIDASNLVSSQAQNHRGQSGPEDETSCMIVKRRLVMERGGVQRKLEKLSIQPKRRLRERKLQ